MSRKSVICFIALCLISLLTSLPTFAQSAKPTRAKKRTGAQAQIPQDRKLTPENLANSARHIWLQWYQARQAGKDLPTPVLSLPEPLNPKEATRARTVWENARVEAHMAVFKKAAYQMWFDWYQAQQQGKEAAQPSLKISSNTAESNQVWVIWQDEQRRAEADVQRQAASQAKPKTEIFDSTALERKAAEGDPEPVEPQPQPARPLVTPIADNKNVASIFGQRQRGIAEVASAPITTSMKEAGFNLATYDNPIIGQPNSNNANVVGAVSTSYLVDDNNPTGLPQVVEELQGGHVVKQYTYGHSLLSQRQLINGQWVTSFYVHDGQGTVRFLTDASGNVTDSYEFDAFGNLINQTGSTPNNYLYSGEQFDPDLNLYYNRDRYLNVNTGRFWTQDSYEGIKEEPLSLHKYLYANGNPINNIDPSGHFAVSIAASSILSTVFATAPVMNINTFSAVKATANVTIKQYDVINSDVRKGIPTGGLNVQFGANISNKSPISEYRWIQYVTNNIALPEFTNVKPGVPFLDPFGRDVSYPFYWDPQEEQVYTDFMGFDKFFEDQPRRRFAAATKKKSNDFKAETFLMEVTPKGTTRYRPLVKIDWGFKVTYNKQVIPDKYQITPLRKP